MNPSLAFVHAWALLLLPVAVLPLLRQRRHALVVPQLAWLPADRAGAILGWAWRLLAAAAMLAIVLAIAQPVRPDAFVPRIGRGAEIVLLIDRSRSMDERMLPADWRTIDPLNLRYQAQSRGEPKGKVARELLSRFVRERADDRFALIFFSTNPIRVVRFTQHDEVVQAGIAAGGIGRGLADTDVGRALAAAIAQFDQRAYTGSRIVLLVSDGGARLDAATKQRLRSAARRNRVTLDWIYLRSVNSPRLDTPGDAGEAVPEIALHRFFQSLPGSYRAYEADDPAGLARAVADVGRQQNFPLDYLEEVPRRDFSRLAMAVAAACCALMLALRAAHDQVVAMRRRHVHAIFGAAGALLAALVVAAGAASRASRPRRPGDRACRGACRGRSRPARGAPRPSARTRRVRPLRGRAGRAQGARPGRARAAARRRLLQPRQPPPARGLEDRARDAGRGGAAGGTRQAELSRRAARRPGRLGRPLQPRARAAARARRSTTRTAHDSRAARQTRNAPSPPRLRSGATCHEGARPRRRVARRRRACGPGRPAWRARSCCWPA